MKNNQSQRYRLRVKCSTKLQQRYDKVVTNTNRMLIRKTKDTC